MDKFSLKIYASLFFPFIFAGVGIFKVVAMVQEPDGQLDELYIWLGLLLGAIMWLLESREILKLAQSIEVYD